MARWKYYKYYKEAIGVITDLESTIIRDGDDSAEAISVGELHIRVFTAYGAQEYYTKETKEKLLFFIEEEVSMAEINGQGWIIQMAGNLHAGNSLVEKLPQSPESMIKTDKCSWIS